MQFKHLELPRHRLPVTILFIKFICTRARPRCRVKHSRLSSGLFVFPLFAHGAFAHICQPSLQFLQLLQSPRKGRRAHEGLQTKTKSTNSNANKRSEQEHANTLGLNLT